MTIKIDGTFWNLETGECIVVEGGVVVSHKPAVQTGRPLSLTTPNAVLDAPPKDPDFIRRWANDMRDGF